MSPLVPRQSPDYLTLTSPGGIATTIILGSGTSAPSSPAITSSPGTTTALPIVNPSSTPRSVIAGALIGGLIGVIALLFLMWWCCHFGFDIRKYNEKKHRRKHRSSRYSSSTSETSGSTSSSSVERVRRVDPSSVRTRGGYLPEVKRGSRGRTVKKEKSKEKEKSSWGGLCCWGEAAAARRRKRERRERKEEEDRRRRSDQRRTEERRKRHPVTGPGGIISAVHGNRI